MVTKTALRQVVSRGVLGRPLPIQTTTRSISVESILHGSPEAKKIGDAEILQHSRKVARGKYIHSFEVHRVKPDATDAYKKAAEKYYTSIVADSEMKVKLTGGWEVLVGEQDTFVHILEFENYDGYDRATSLFQGSPHEDNHKLLLPYLVSRSKQLNQEFAFFPSSPPRTQGGIFELRTYQLQPGKLLEWENAWYVMLFEAKAKEDPHGAGLNAVFRRRGIEARKKLVAPVGAWFSQVGRLHQVHHIWQYRDLQNRKEIREQAWELEGWSETVSKTAQMTTTMDASILTALPYSPLK